MFGRVTEHFPTCDSITKSSRSLSLNQISRAANNNSFSNFPLSMPDATDQFLSGGCVSCRPPISRAGTGVLSCTRILPSNASSAVRPGQISNSNILIDLFQIDKQLRDRVWRTASKTSPKALECGGTTPLSVFATLQSGARAPHSKALRAEPRSVYVAAHPDVHAEAHGRKVGDQGRAPGA